MLAMIVREITKEIATTTTPRIKAKPMPPEPRPSFT